jgi:hypothetical protein
LIFYNFNFLIRRIIKIDIKKLKQQIFKDRWSNDIWLEPKLTWFHGKGGGPKRRTKRRCGALQSNTEQKGESNCLCPANDGKKHEPNAPDAQLPALAISNFE